MPHTTLYLGIDPTNYISANTLVHCPIIETIPCDFQLPYIQHVFADILHYTHLIFTSKTAVRVFFSCLNHHNYQSEILRRKEIIVIGKATAAVVEDYGGIVAEIAKEETQEGIIKILARKNINHSFILLPCSSRSRPHLAHFLMIQRIRHQLCKMYETRTRQPKEKPSLDQIDEIVFTSPSTVDAFQEVFGEIPRNKILTSIGPITKDKLKSMVL